MEKVYLSWESPSWLFKERNKDFFKNIAAIVFFLLVILFFAREFPLILAVLALVFLLYVFATVRPANVTHKITNFGIETYGKFYPWEIMREFWFETQWEKKMVIISLMQGQRIMMILDGVTEQEVKDVIMRFLPLRKKAELSLSDQVALWFSKKIPLEHPRS